MTSKNSFYKTKRYEKLVIGSILPIALIVLLIQVLTAQQVMAAADIQVTKSVDRLEARHGDTVQYSINMNNVGDEPTVAAVMTDTVPSDLTVISSSVSIQGGYDDSWGVAGNVITWTGSISESEVVDINFDVVVSDTAVFEPITNTAYLTGTGSLLSDEAVFTVTEAITYFTYFPIIFKPPPVPTLLSVSFPTSSNGYDTYQMTATWSDVGLTGHYELQESRTPDFANPTTYNVGIATSKTVSFNISRYYKHYYRVRFVMDIGLGSDWSNVILQYGAYQDNFNDNTSGWKIRREDTDDVDNDSYYQNSNYVLKIRGRWDFAIGSPMIKIPWDSYRIETKVRFDPGLDNLHSYGIIWGGDWNGSTECPNNGFTSCLNHYYRLNVLWYGNKDHLRTQIKRIDYHDSDGVGRGVGLADYANNTVANPSGGWQYWTVDHYSYGTIRLSVNGGTIRTVYNESTYGGSGTYFGAFATSNEYSGTEPWYDWVRLTPLP